MRCARVRAHTGGTRGRGGAGERGGEGEGIVSKGSKGRARGEGGVCGDQVCVGWRAGKHTHTHTFQSVQGPDSMCVGGWSTKRAWIQCLWWVGAPRRPHPPRQGLGGAEPSRSPSWSQPGAIRTAAAPKPLLSPWYASWSTFALAPVAWGLPSFRGPVAAFFASLPG